MPAPRGDVFAQVDLGHSAPDVSRYGTVNSVSAQAIDCPECAAEAGQPCTTGKMSTGRNPVPLLCGERIELAALMRDSGELPVTVIQRQVTVEVQEPSRSRKMTDEKIGRMHELRAAGWTQPKIAAELGVSIPTVVKYCKERPRPLATTGALRGSRS
jgi:DNA-binding XRE family transcriptional regulator